MLQTLIQKRSNGYYYFRWVYPSALKKLTGKRELVKSLRTASKSQALARAGAYYMAVEKLKNQVAGLSLDDMDFRISIDSEYSQPLRVRQDGELLTPEEESLFESHCKSIYDQQVPKFFRALLTLPTVFIAGDFSEANNELERLDRFFQMYDSPNNALKEFAEGRSVYDITERFLWFCARMECPDINYVSRTQEMSHQALYGYSELFIFLDGR